MPRASWTAIAILLALLWATRFVVDPRAPTGPTDAVAEKQKGDRAFDAEQWWQAGRQYRLAFALEDPRDPERVTHRAFLAQQAGVAYARVATAAPADAAAGERRDAKRLATLWLEEALALDGTRGWVHFERASLFDRTPEALRDPALAREAYAAFVAWVEDAGRAGRGKPAPDDLAVALARDRIKQLGE